MANLKKKSQDQQKTYNICIMGIPFEIQVLDKIDEDNAHGEMVGLDRIIKLRRDQTDIVMIHTFVHEYIHAVLYITGHSYTMKSKVEEAIVTALEHGMTKLCNFNNLEEIITYLNKVPEKT